MSDVLAEGADTGEAAVQGVESEEEVMLSIEEAAKSLQRTYMAAGFAAISGNKDTIKAAFAAHEDAIRAGFLAVLEEAENSGCIYPGCDHPCTDCPIDALRAKIKALGKEAKS